MKPHPLLLLAERHDQNAAELRRLADWREQQAIRYRAIVARAQEQAEVREVEELAGGRVRIAGDEAC